MTDHGKYWVREWIHQDCDRNGGELKKLYDFLSKIRFNKKKDGVFMKQAWLVGIVEPYLCSGRSEQNIPCTTF